MARYDKYDPVSSGFRAPLAANLTLTAGTSNGVSLSPGVGPVGVSLDANGRVVVGGSGGDLSGVLVKNMPAGSVAGSAQLAAVMAQPMGAMAGDIVDIMVRGEIVDLTGLTAGTAYYADATTGELTTTATGNFYVGTTVEASRLVVNFCGVPAA